MSNLEIVISQRVGTSFDAEQVGMTAGDELSLIPSTEHLKLNVTTQYLLDRHCFRVYLPGNTVDTSM